MVPSSAGSVVLVRFPFSDLSASKLRPAVVLAFSGQNECILCQVTSNPYSDPRAIPLLEEAFESGSMYRPSFARPGKLFTASTSIMSKEAGVLDGRTFSRLLDAVIAILDVSRKKT